MKELETIVSGDENLDRVQGFTKRSLKQIIDKEILNGVLFENQSITFGSPCTIYHKLERVPNGIIVVKKNTNAVIKTELGTQSDKTITLNAYSQPNSEAVFASYWVEGAVSANTSVAAGATEIIDYQHEIYDSHDAVTVGAAWKFTAPVAGYYNVSYSIPLGGSAANATGEGRIYKNGALVTRGSEIHFNSLNWNVLGSSSIIKLAVDDYIDIRGQNNDVAGAVTVNGSATTMESVSIHKIYDNPISTSVTVDLWVF
ncbi:MAG: hypothetical protein GY861_01055 [bacterium]|nr:hypothetical protein [bacterium]